MTRKEIKDAGIAMHAKKKKKKKTRKESESIYYKALSSLTAVNNYSKDVGLNLHISLLYHPCLCYFLACHPYIYFRFSFLVSSITAPQVERER